MGFIDRLFGRKKSLTPEQYERNSAFLRSMYRFFGMGLPTTITQNTQHLINNGYEMNNNVYSVVNYISEQAANVPLVVQRRNGEEWEAVDKMHPLQKLIDQPNPYQSGIEQRQQFYSMYLVTGNGFRYAPRVDGGMNEGQAQEMWIMPTQYTEILQGGWMQPIVGYRIEWQGGTENVLPFDDVMHMRTTNLEFGNGAEFWGMSPLRAGLLALNRSNSAYVAADASYKNLGAAGIITETEGPMMPSYSDELQAEKEADWTEKYNGPVKKGKMMFHNKKVDFIRLNMSPADLQLLQDANATKDDICNLYKISSIIFNNHQSSTYNNALEAKKAAYNDAILPMVQREIDEFMKWIVPSYGDDLRIIADTSNIPILQQDLERLAAWTGSLVDKGILSRNEAREVMGNQRSNEPEMDVYTVGFNTIPLTDATTDTMATPEAEKALKDMGVKHYLDGSK